jgi:drug/metabolite transporter (DMT)-like permease
MNLYIYLAIAVNFIWGLAFLVPYYLQDVNPIVIVMGRYAVYGLVSLVLFVFGKRYWHSFTSIDWKKALLFAFAGNVGYYLMVTLAIHYAGVALVALIVGTMPITMAIYGNWTTREFPFRNLMASISLVLIGLSLLNWYQYSHLPMHHTVLQLIIGSVCAIFALLLWTWYGVANATYLKKNPEISSNVWSISVGIACLFQIVLILPLLMLTTHQFQTFNIEDGHKLFQIIMGSLILGLLVSWLATIGWNKVSRHLPTALAAQLIVFETISSLLYSFLLDHQMPRPMLLFSVFIVLAGVTLGIRMVHQSTNAYQSD